MRFGINCKERFQSNNHSGKPALKNTKNPPLQKDSCVMFVNCSVFGIKKVGG